MRTAQYFRNMDALGDMLKAIEASHELRLLPNVPIYARLDGKAFSKFTKGLRKPYDPALTALMVAVTQTLVTETGANLGYTQSDEISLFWDNDRTQRDMPFAGRRDKSLGELAGLATAAFMRGTMKAFPERLDKLPRFDCRVFNCSREDAANFFLWRHMDAEKNSVTLVASEHFSHKRLQGVSSKQRREWLFEAGDPWEAYPAFFRRGVFVGKFTRDVPVAAMDVPEHIKPSLPETVERHLVQAFTRDPLQRLPSPLEVFNLDEQACPDITFIHDFPVHGTSRKERMAGEGAV